MIGVIGAKHLRAVAPQPSGQLVGAMNARLCFLRSADNDVSLLLHNRLISNSLELQRTARSRCNQNSSGQQLWMPRGNFHRDHATLRETERYRSSRTDAQLILGLA